MNPADIRTVYLAPEEFSKPLELELKGIIGRRDHLIFTDQPPQNVFWAQNIWRQPTLIEIDNMATHIMVADQHAESTKIWTTIAGGRHVRKPAEQHLKPRF